MATTQTTWFLTVTGPDQPGVTSRLFSSLAEYHLSVVDLEQVVICGRLILGISLRGEPALNLAPIRAVTSQLGLEVHIDRRTSELPRTRSQLHVTVLGSPLVPTAAIAAIARQITNHGANIDRIDRLADQPVVCLEMDVSGADPDALRAALTRESAKQGVDVAVQRGGLSRRAMRLVILDVDSTLIVGETIDLLASRAGCAEQVAKVTASAMRGELDFTPSLRERVAMLAGLPESVIDDVWQELRLAPGARTLIHTLQRLGYRCGIVSGGFTQFTNRLSAELGINYTAANTLEIVQGKLTGRLCGQIIDRPGKARALRRFAADAGVPLSQTVAIGDGANDLDMIATAGLGIAFNAKQVVRDAADVSVNVPYLDTVLYLLGVSRDELDASDDDGSSHLRLTEINDQDSLGS